MRGPLASGLALLLAHVAGCDDWRVVDAVRPSLQPGSGALCETRHVDPEQQTRLGPEDRSHWLQPWRAWLDTWPARRMREGLGITVGGAASDVGYTRLNVVQASGLARVYTEINWNEADFDTPSRLRTSAREQTRAWLSAIKDRKLRAHIMLQGHHGLPCPIRSFPIRVIEAAAVGARRIKIDPAALPMIALGRTGLSASNRTPGVLFTAAAPDGTLTLSKPLPEARPAGTHNAHQMRFAPFQRPVRADGSPNPAFEETMKGWEQFLAAVAAEARAVLGNDGFDVEIWNELGGGSDFLDANNYHDPRIDDGPGAPYELVTRAMLERSIAFFRNPATGTPGARVVSGFSNGRFTDAGSNLPPGAVMSRHLALHGAAYPADAARESRRSLRADGQPNGAAGADRLWKESFTPSYVAALPEQGLVPLLYPKVIFPDLSPLTSMDAAGNAHGRLTRPQGGGASPAVIVSSYNLSPSSRILELGSATSPSGAAELWRFKAKGALRAAAAYVGKGADAFIYYSTSDAKIDLIDETDPATGGPVMRALRRFLDAFAGPDAIAQPRSLALETVASCAQGRQFDGDGTAQFPPLWNAEVVAFFPFQIDDARFVAPVYVMTRNLGKVWRPAAAPTDVSRYDMPPETFTLTLAGLRAGNSRAELLDPLSGEVTPVPVQALGGGRAALEVALTDSVRLLTLTDP